MKVRMGLVGLGNIGREHLRYLLSMDDVELAALCDVDEAKANLYAERHGIPAFYTHIEMMEKAELDAVIVAVPHYDHGPIAIDAFQKGIHVLCEKPITVHVNLAQKIIGAYEEAKKTYPGLLFAMMFQERTRPHAKKIKDLLESGELGRLTRVTWINTAWFRSQAYYDSGDWRATWAGEGGGILTNQCPHDLDMYHWFFGLPRRINGFAHIGKFHDIEVEDEVTAYMEHEDGMISHFIVTTGECPGENRMEIVGENGTLVYQAQKITFYRNRRSMLKFSRMATEGFAKLENWECEIPIDFSEPSGHQVVTERFVRSIIRGDSNLVASGTEGLNPVMMANAIMLSSFEDKTIFLPIDGDAFEEKLNELIALSV